MASDGENQNLGCDMHPTSNERQCLALGQSLGGSSCTLKHVRVDDWVFGVSSVSKDGFESPVASAVPGGAFKPWVKPAEESPSP